MLGAATRILFAHAHPDDETLATGALIAWLARDEGGCATGDEYPVNGGLHMS